MALCLLGQLANAASLVRSHWEVHVLGLWAHLGSIVKIVKITPTTGWSPLLPIKSSLWDQQCIITRRIERPLNGNKDFSWWLLHIAGQER